MKIYLASILLEPNRWTEDKAPSIEVSSFANRICELGFDGCELWENHYLRATALEQKFLRSGKLPISIFNTYSDPEQSPREFLHRVSVARLLGAWGMKFNVGRRVADTQRLRRILTDAANAFSGGTLLCECHPGTAFEDPDLILQFTETTNRWPFDLIVHPFVQGNGLASWFASFGGRIAHSHIQARDKNDASKFVRLREPDTAGLDVLRQNRYRGTFALEFCYLTGTSSDNAMANLTAAGDDMTTFRALWV